MLEQTWTDARVAWRTLRHSPVLSLVAVASLAIGIGANTTIFSIVNALLVRPRPGIVETGLVDVGRTQDGTGFDNMSYLNYVDYRDAGRGVLSGLAALRMDPRPVSLGADDGARRIYGQSVSGNYFDVLGVRPALGRSFRPEEDAAAGDHHVVVLSHRFWRDEFGAGRPAIGSIIRLNGEPFTVIGVAPEHFTGTMVVGADVWMPLHALAPSGLLDSRASVWLVAIGRLAPGVTIDQAQAVLAATAERLRRAYPDDNKGKGVRVLRSSAFPDQLGTMVTAFMSLLMALVGLVLLIASVNVAGLLLARAADRRREMAIRLALGSGRARLVRQLLTESLALFAAGGAAGLALAAWMRHLVLAFIPQLPVPVAIDLPLDVRVLAFTAVISLAAGLLTGLAPALHASRGAIVPALKDDGQGTGGRTLRVRNILVASQVALTMVLVVAAGLFLRALQGAGRIDPGFDPTNVEIASLDLSLSAHTEASGGALIDALLDRVRAIPGVQSAAVAVDLPLDGSGFGLGGVRPSDRQLPDGGLPSLDWNIVSPAYHRTMGIAIVAGRAFLDSDRQGTPRVAIINQTLAAQLWPGQSPIGRHLINLQPDGDLDLEVVGVEKDLKYRSLGEKPRPFIYVPMAQRYFQRFSLVVKRAGGPSTVPAVRAIVRQLDANLPVIDAQALTAYVGVGLLPQRLAVSVAGSLGAVGLLLAAIGIYGVIAYAVSRRRREIGLRMALGAQPSDVVRLVLAQGARLAAIGIGVGLLLALGASRLVAGLLYGIGPGDPVTYAVAAVVLAGMTIAACWVPARRAAAVDPMTALRSD